MIANGRHPNNPHRDLRAGIESRVSVPQPPASDSCKCIFHVDPGSEIPNGNLLGLSKRPDSHTNWPAPWDSPRCQIFYEDQHSQLIESDENETKELCLKTDFSCLIVHRGHSTLGRSGTNLRFVESRKAWEAFV